MGKRKKPGMIDGNRYGITWIGDIFLLRHFQKGFHPRFDLAQIAWGKCLPR
jgi:hypothetical protein